MRITFLALATLTILGSCETGPSESPEKPLPNGDESKIYSSTIKTLTDVEYPDNNDIESRSDLWDDFDHHTVEIVRNDETDFTLTFIPSNDISDTIFIENVNLLAWMPTIPSYITDDYLKHIGIINAEWNRHQVKLSGNEFRLSKGSKEQEKTVRIDLARNCLNAYAWEIITYTEEEGKQKSMYHGWFDFPHDMYIELFDEVNKDVLTFEEYKNHLENYKDPHVDHVNLDHLRTLVSSTEVAFENLNHLGYPKTGARKSKYKNIVCPKAPETINDFLTDSTSFSTFQWPGYYDTKDPRPSMLGRMANPLKVTVNEIQSLNSIGEECLEFQIQYASKEDPELLTTIIVGGVAKSAIPTLAMNDYNKGFKYPMGIGNHAFYETYQVAQENNVKDSPYYAFVLDGNDNWIDSHFFGVDGPLLHFDAENPSKLHFWMLSFERHAMVTHLVFELNK